MIYLGIGAALVAFAAIWFSMQGEPNIVFSEKDLADKLREKP